MAQPLVSVCIPCFNAEAYVVQTLEAVLAQSWPHVEIIVVNDGSTDHSWSLLQGFHARGVQLIDQPRSGQCAAANRAFAHSSGQLIKFLDADDLIPRDFIMRQVGRLAGRQNAVASASWGRFYGNDLNSFRLNPQSVWRDMNALDWLVEAWSDAQPMMQCGLWLIPRPLLERSGGWDERLSLINDFEFFARVLSLAEDVLFTPGEPLYYRSGLAGSLSGEKTREAIESAFHSIVRGTAHLLACRSDVAARRSCANVMQGFIYDVYPQHADLRERMAQRIQQLGGSNLPPPGGPRFQILRRMMGWKLATRLQQLNRA